MPTNSQGKKHQSSRTIESTEDDRNKKRERKKEKQAKKGSTLDDQLTQLRAREIIFRHRVLCP